MNALSPTIGIEGMQSSAPAYAGFWRRFLAWLIDDFVKNTLFAVAAFVPGFAAVLLFGEEKVLKMIWDSPAVNAGSMVGAFFIHWLYYALMESSAGQATLGKRALSIKVTNLEGRPVTFGRASARFFGRLLSMSTFGIGYLLVAFTKRKQALHDMVAGTIVVKV